MDRLLEQVARRLGYERLTPKDGKVPIWFRDAASSGEAWDTVRKALDESDPQWDELVSIEPRRDG
jgi:hypothetical protein